MNSKTLEYIKENWELLLSPNAQEFRAVLLKTPLKTPLLMMEALEKKKTIQELSEELQINANTLAAISRTLEEKIFIGFQSGTAIELELLPAKLKKNEDKNALDQTAASTSSPPSPNDESRMRGILPGPQHYVRIESSSRRYLFRDKRTTMLEISSPVADPWNNQEWQIVAFRQNFKNKNATQRWPYKLQLKLFPPSADALEIEIKRKVIKSHFAYGDYSPVQFFGFPTNQEKEWVFYSLYRKK